MKRKELQQILLTIHEKLLSAHGPQECALVHSNAFELLVATILSAQCTDKMVNTVTPELFRRYPTAAALAAADRAELEKIIHPCGFYRAKANSLLGAAQKIVSDFNGEVPGNMDDLTSLPGVGRKTANVVLGDAFHVPGLPVDTHVKRITNKIGLVRSDDPVEIEQRLCANLPPELWSSFSHLIIIHGRTRCPARKPDCGNCEIKFCCKTGKAEK